MSFRSITNSFILEAVKVGAATLILGPQKLGALASSMLSRWAVRTYFAPPSKENLISRELMDTGFDTAMFTLSVQGLDQLSHLIEGRPNLVNRGISSFLVKSLRAKSRMKDIEWGQMKTDALMTIMRAYLITYASNFVSDYVLQEDNDPTMSSQYAVLLGGMASEVLWYYGNQYFAKSSAHTFTQEAHSVQPKLTGC